MPTTNDRISLVNDTEDVTAVKAPSPGLLRESKVMPARKETVRPGHAEDDGSPTPPPVVASPKPVSRPAAPAAQSTAPPGAKSPLTARPPAPAPHLIAPRTTDARAVVAKAATTMAAVASTSSATAKPASMGKPLAPPPIARPLASSLAPSSAPARPEILGPTPPAGLPALGSGALPFIRPKVSPARTAGVPVATPSSETQVAPGAPVPPVPTLPFPPLAPIERRPPTPAGGSALPFVDLVPLTPSSGPLFEPKPDAWTTRSPGGRSRVALYAGLALVVIAGAGIGWKQWWAARAGRIEISTTPAGALVMLGGDSAAHHAPVAFEKPPGRYTVSVTRDGFERDDRTVDLHAGQDVVLSIALAPVAAAKPVALMPEPIGGARAAGARHALAPSPGAPRASMVRAPTERSIGRLDAASTARATARAMALASATQDDSANPPVPGVTPTTPVAEAAPPLPAAGSAAKAEAPATAVPANAAAPAAPAKAAPFEKSGAPPAEVAGARTISGRLAKAQLVIDANADEYRVKLPPSLARADMKLSAVVKMCVSAEGKVAEVKLLKSADPAIDAQIPAVLAKWRYRPLVVDGRAVPFCYVLQYEIAAP